MDHFHGRYEYLFIESICNDPKVSRALSSDLLIPGETRAIGSIDPNVG